MYQPGQEILKKYADVLIKCALWSGEGLKPGDVVYLQIPEFAKPLLLELQKSILEAGGHYIINFLPDQISRPFFDLASDEQLKFEPLDYYLALVKTCTHFVRIDGSNDKYELKGVDPKKIMENLKTKKRFVDARTEKESRGELTWTIGLYPTEAMAKDAGMSLKEYWDEIITSCFLNEADPILKWKEVFSGIKQIQKKLDAMKIEEVHVKGIDADIRIKIGADRQWLGGSGRNIPSFEIFTSPDWRGTNGWIRFNQPLYRYGNRISGIELEFKDGIIVRYSAEENEELLKEMIGTKNADKIGEFSLTDRRFSKITKFMGETLYDENVGGEFGNTHLAVGASFKDAYVGDIKNLTSEDCEKLGLNESVIHTDIMSTANRTVTATLGNGEQKVIYENGEFKI